VTDGNGRQRVIAAALAVLGFRSTGVKKRGVKNNYVKNKTVGEDEITDRGEEIDRVD